jgi:nitroreductase/FMN reductase [NAD(P)H]
LRKSIPVFTWPGKFEISLNSRIQSRFGLSNEIGKTTEGNGRISNILTRRSHRAFRQEEISEDLLNTLFATAFSAPSKSDLQQACVIHVDAFMNAAVDAGICMQTFIIAAESFGLGRCPVSEIRNQVQLLSDELELPKHVFPVAGLCLGWPQQDSRLSMRLPLTTTVKTNRYNDDELFTEVADYGLRREEIEQTPAAQQRFVEAMGVAENYGWSENRTRQYSRPAREDFGSYIRRQGFNLS